MPLQADVLWRVLACAWWWTLFVAGQRAFLSVALSSGGKTDQIRFGFFSFIVEGMVPCGSPRRNQERLRFLVAF